MLLLHRYNKLSFGPKLIITNSFSNVLATLITSLGMPTFQVYPFKKNIIKGNIR